MDKIARAKKLADIDAAKIRILEGMVEDRTREAFLEGQKTSSINELLKNSMLADDLAGFCRTGLETFITQPVVMTGHQGIIFLTEKDSLRLMPQTTINMGQVSTSLCQRCRRKTCPGLEAMATNQVIIGQDTLGSTCEYLAQFGCACAIPLTGSGEKSLGVILLSLPNKMRIDHEESSFFLSLANIIGVTIQRLLVEQEMALYQVNLEEMVQEKTEALSRTNIDLLEQITANKQVEKALQSEKEKLAVTLRSIGDGVVTTDTAGRVTFINKIAEELTGWQLEDGVGRPLTEVFNIVNETTGEVCENPAHKVLASGKIIGLANHTALVAKDGKMRSIADSGAPIRDKDSNIIGVVLVFRDVTEQNKQEKEIAKTRKLEAIGVLAGGIAHDFNNILTAIVGNINLASFMIGPESKAFEMLKTAEKASARAKGLTQQLLTFAKGGEPLREITSISAVIKDSADFVLRGSKTKCNYSIADNLWPVHIDANQISQVVQNLIINASFAMPDGGWIDISCDNTVMANDRGSKEKTPHVKLVFKDQGRGIPQQDIDKIFDPYFTTKAEGSGLGLAICHSIIKKHGGKIMAASTQGNGAIFTIFLPASSKSAPSPADELTSHEDTKTNTIRVLVMDDDEFIRDVAEQMLTYAGYETILANDGEQALKLYLESRESGKPIDMVIMDLTIPGGIGGKEAVQQLLAIDPQAKVVVASGYSNDPIMAAYQDFGFVGKINKPFVLEELIAEVSKSVSGGETT